MQLFRNRKGFTLVELMVVVIIVLVLAGIAVPVYIHYIQEGKKSEAYATIDAIVSGGLVYFQKNGTYTGGDIGPFLAQDDVDNATYFTYLVSDQADGGFTATATVNNLDPPAGSGAWGPGGAQIIWIHQGANVTLGNAGTGTFSEAGNW